LCVRAVVCVFLAGTTLFRSGMSAALLGRTQIGKECLIAAGAVVPPGLIVPDRMCVMGVPGKIVRTVTEEELKYMRWLAPHYLERTEEHTSELQSREDVVRRR